MYCGKCGVENPNDNSFCYSCGKPLTKGTSLAQSSAPAEAIPVIASDPNSSAAKNEPNPSHDDPASLGFAKDVAPKASVPSRWARLGIFLCMWLVSAMVVEIVFGVRGDSREAARHFMSALLKFGLAAWVLSNFFGRWLTFTRTWIAAIVVYGLALVWLGITLSQGTVADRLTNEAIENERMSQVTSASRSKPSEGQEAREREQSSRADQLERGVWADPVTGLVWLRQDNGQDVNWNQASHYCRSLNFAGYRDWRLPTIDELSVLYDKTQDVNRRHIRGGIRLAGWFGWSSSTGNHSNEAWGLDFLDGGRYSDPIGDSLNGFALCVRRPEKNHSETQ